jgi:MFS transporter, DHA1 family, tetracycline resistance protein
MPQDTKPLRILCLVAVIDILGFGILIPLVPYMGERFGAEPRTITWILGAYSLCQLIAAPFWGRLSDRYGRRPILITSLAGACVSYLILCFARNVEWLLASRMLAGFMAGNLAAAFAYASDVSKPEDRAKSLGMVGASIGIGFMLGPAIGGTLAGNDEQSANFALPATVSAALSILAIVLVKVALPESHPHHERVRSRERRALTPLQLFAQRPPLRFIAGAALLVTTAQGILESIFAIWALHKFGFGPRTVGLMLFGLAVVAVSMQGGFVRVLVPKLGETRLATIGIASYITGLFIVAQAGMSLPLTIFGFALCGIGAGAFNPSASALASKQSTVSDRGVVMGTYSASTSLARVIGPFISGPIYVMFGPDAPFLAGACVMIPALWLIWGYSTISVSKMDTA